MSIVKTKTKLESPKQVEEKKIFIRKIKKSSVRSLHHRS